MPDFRTVCQLADLPEGGSRVAEIDGRLVAIFQVDGRFHAIDDVCPHMGASLADGMVESGVVTCPWHSWRFRLADGAWADCPAVKVECHLVRVVGTEVQVCLVASAQGRRAMTEDRDVSTT